MLAFTFPLECLLNPKSTQGHAIIKKLLLSRAGHTLTKIKVTGWYLGLGVLAKETKTRIVMEALRYGRFYKPLNGSPHIPASSTNSYW